MKAMRLLAVLAVAGMLASTSAMAGGLTGKGIRAGINLANATGDDADMTGMTKKMRMGIVGGAFVQYSFSDLIAIEPAVHYSQGGAKYDVTGAPVVVTAKYDYVEIPILLRVTIPTEGGVKPSIFVGPSIGILMTAEWSSDQAGSTPMDVKDQTKGTNISLAAGAGVAIPAGNGKVTLDAGYGMGLSSIDDSGSDADIKTNAITVVLGYSF